MKVTFFNQPWLERRYRPGTRLLLTGKFQGASRGFRVQRARRRPARRRAGDEVADLPGHRGALVDPDRRAGPRAPRRRSATCSSRCRRGCGSRERLPDRPAALDAAHFGDQEGGRRRLAFDELLLLQLALLRRRARRREGARAARAGAAGRADRALAGATRCRSRRPATSGPRWRRSTRTSPRERPMQRLLMGEVGSGKTVVALYAMLRAVESGAQAALMAPTETLAEQHFATLQTLMPGELVQAALLTGSTPAGAARRPARQAGERASCSCWSARTR